MKLSAMCFLVKKMYSRGASFTVYSSVHGPALKNDVHGQLALVVRLQPHGGVLKIEGNFIFMKYYDLMFVMAIGI